MTILVTAFGPFVSRPENGSSLVLRDLKIKLLEIRTRILLVDSVIVPARIRRALRIIRREIPILLGEAAVSKNIHLETTAFNELHFRIPDLSGRQPTHRAIRDDAPPIRRSTLPLQKINNLLRAKNHDVTLSNNPGRYRCKQMLFVALEFLEPHSIPFQAGFIHLPLAVDYPTGWAPDAVSRVIRLF